MQIHYKEPLIFDKSEVTFKQNFSSANLERKARREWLGDQDSNLGSQIQSLMSYRLDDPPNLGVTLLACPSSVKRSVRVTR